MAISCSTWLSMPVFQMQKKCKKRDATCPKCSHTFFSLLWLLLEKAVRLPCKPQEASQRQKLMLTSCGDAPFHQSLSPLCTSQLLEEQSLPSPPSASCRKPGTGRAGSSPELLPKALASQQDRDWKVALKSSTYNPSLLFLTVSPAGTEVSICFLIHSTPGSFFLAVPAGRMWCIKESQLLKLERPMVFNHFLHPPTWAGVFLTIFFSDVLFSLTFKYAK